MPPLVWGGHSFLFGSDDLALLAPVSVFWHLLWLLADLDVNIRRSANNLGIPLRWLTNDAVLCGALLATDSLIFVFGARGPIMDPTRRSGVPALLYVRAVLSIPMLMSILLVCSALGASLVNWTLRCFDGTPPAVHSVFLVDLVFLSLMYVRALGYGIFLTILYFGRIGKFDMKDVVGKVLSVFGISDDMIYGITEVVASLFQDGIFQRVTPTDLAFGAILRSARQRQQMGRVKEKFLGTGKDDEEKRVHQTSPFAHMADRASAVPGAVALKGNNEQDAKAMAELNHYIPSMGSG